MPKNIKRYRMQILSLTFLLSFLSCSHKDLRKEKIEDFIMDLIDKNTNQEQIISEYFITFPDSTIYNELYKEVLFNFRSCLQSSSIEVLPYNEAKKKFNIYKNTDEDNHSIYIVKLDSSLIIYVNMKNDKIRSISPIIKGNTIIGWL